LPYCNDTSATLDGWKRYYPPDVFPSLWKYLEGLIAAVELIAPDEVLHELARNDDEVFQWAKAQVRMFVSLDEDIQRATQEVLAAFPKLVDTRKDRRRADPFVIALAEIRLCVVVTNERNQGIPSRPRIPGVCEHFGIQCITLLQLMQDKGWSFHRLQQLLHM
jgi:hypothetical protein